MVEFFKSGGWGMFPILGLGLVLVATSGSFALTGRKETEPFVDRIMQALTWTVLVATATDLSAVGYYLAKQEVFHARIAAEGFAESMSPLAFGGGFMMIAAVLAAVGRRRVHARMAPATA